MKLMNTSFHESSPNETESDSGVFTSSYSKYSLDSLQDDKDQDNRLTFNAFINSRHSIGLKEWCWRKIYPLVNILERDYNKDV